MSNKPTKSNSPAANEGETPSTQVSPQMQAVLDEHKANVDKWLPRLDKVIKDTAKHNR